MIWLLLILLWLIVFGATWYAFHRGRLKSPWHLDVIVLGLLALAVLGFFWRVVAGQNWMPADGGDLVSFLFPTYRFAAATIRDGAWPLWNPYLYGGAPHVGDIQAGFLYPPNLILFLLRPEFPYVALQWLSIGHIWFAGAGMYLLLARGLRVRRVAALTGALGVHVLRRVHRPLRQPELHRGGELAAVGVLGVRWKLDCPLCGRRSWSPACGPVVTRYSLLVTIPDPCCAGGRASRHRDSGRTHPGDAVHRVGAGDLRGAVAVAKPEGS